MDKATAHRLVKATFQAPFDKDRYRAFINELCNGFDESKAQSMAVPDAFTPHVKSCQRLGTYLSPTGELVDILVVRLTESYKLARTRTALRDFVAHKLKRGDNYKEAGLVAFVAPDSRSWRFSLVRMEYEAKRDPLTGRIRAEERLTPARRFSYLVGVDEECHTAQARFLPLLQQASSSPTLDQLEDAFSVEAVTKEFFEEYVRLFNATNAALIDLVEKDSILSREFSDKGVTTVSFAKKMLGQIVFLYFLQKKGWLGVSRGAAWGTGPIDFMSQLALRASPGGSLFNDILEPLFYDTLATDRGDEAWCPALNARIPFLNGGLFEPLAGYDWRNTDISLPDRLFTNRDVALHGSVGTGIIDVFDRYNFTVSEAEPLEKDVAIDPEMLGKVFENLIEENRRKGLGAFYTPREVVHFMCQSSLCDHLDAAMLREGVSIERADVEQFIREGEQASHWETARTGGTAGYQRRLPKPVEDHAPALDNALADIAVCDPAIGSGAFPVGMMTEIVRARAALTPYLGDDGARTPYRFKRHAIESCLYGVDIDAGAVEIAKLRLWLSLVVDEDDVSQINPLPNLDYKVVVGDSLGGVERNLFNTDTLDEIERLKPLYFNESDKEKKGAYRRRIDSLILEITNDRATFDFETYFSEVFHDRGGFDVVIANPPYVSVEKFARTANQAQWKKRFQTYAARGDIYCLFYERGLELLRDGGTLTFISSNKFQRSGYGKALRQLLVSKRIRSLIDFCELPVFGAAADTMIVSVSADLPSGELFPVLVVKEPAELSSLWQSLDTGATLYSRSQLGPDGWQLEGSGGLDLVEKIRQRGTPLIEYVHGRMHYGIKTGLNEAFVIDRLTRERLIREDPKSADLIKPWIRGKDIKRWTHEFDDKYIIVVRFGFHSELNKYPAVLRHLGKYETALKARGQCMTSRGGGDQGQHHWLELDNNPSAAYIKYFDEPKIVFNETSKRLHAYLDVEGNAINKTGFIILTPDAAFVLSVLNSRALDWYYRSTFPAWGDAWNSGRIQFRGNLMNLVPIPKADSDTKALLSDLAHMAADAAAHGDEPGLQSAERRIDGIVYDLFGLEEHEIAQIEKSIAVTWGDESANQLPRGGR
jgi:type I restriction-modification system DNA methylase subunit